MSDLSAILELSTERMENKMLDLTEFITEALAEGADLICNECGTYYYSSDNFAENGNFELGLDYCDEWLECASSCGESVVTIQSLEN